MGDGGEEEGQHLHSLSSEILNINTILRTQELGANLVQTG